ncbi:MAG: phosphate signaling complex protein PhoU [Victivallales bacterium]|nr:phosphate signaling complex protein PhoU [Victivallales bacterium]
MKIHLHKEIEHLKQEILILGSMVEGAVRIAVKSVIESDGGKAQKIIDNDRYIDSREIEIEEECLKILALHQPVAADLRYVAACLKVNNELERIGDLGVNIAHRVLAIVELQEKGKTEIATELCVDFQPMMDITRQMLKGALDSLIFMDTEQAMKVIRQDDVVDNYNSKMFVDLQKRIRSRPEQTEYYINLLNVSRHLERIADCTTNICEDVIYMIKGEIIRHQYKKPEKQ